jgi:putative transposase
MIVDVSLNQSDGEANQSLRGDAGPTLFQHTRDSDVMAHSYSSCFIHYVFSTRHRQATITAELRPRLWSYMGGIARMNGMWPGAIGGTDDHAHMLIGLPVTLTIARGAQIIKGTSSRWIHETFPRMHHFAWQEGYGAFSVCRSLVRTTISYILNQESHHRTLTSAEEFRAILAIHGMRLDEHDAAW